MALVRPGSTAQAVSGAEPGGPYESENVARRRQKEFNLSYLFISHDLRVVRHMADEIIVMHQGKIVEQGPTKGIYEKPKANYTRELLNAIAGKHFNFKVS